GDRDPERRTGVVAGEGRVRLARPPDVVDVVGLERPVAVPRARDQLVDNQGEGGRGESGAGNELPLAFAARPCKKPERKCRNADRDRAVALDAVEQSAEPRVMYHEAVDRVVGAPVHRASLAGLATLLAVCACACGGAT